MGILDRRRRRDALPVNWLHVLDARLTHWPVLDAHERARLAELSRRIYAEKRWEAARGFTLTDEMRLLISAQAALLILGLDFEYYRRVRSIIVHPTTMLLRGTRAGPVPGVVTDSPLPIAGQAAHHQGPVVISWNAVAREARHPGRGHNVVFHEFAHKLDMLDNFVDGTPPQHDRDAWDRWVDVCTREYRALQRAPDDLLRGYASVNPGEFFAVATEVFFDRPVDMRTEKRELYDVLAGFYRQDPAERVERDGGHTAAADTAPDPHRPST